MAYYIEYSYKFDFAKYDIGVYSYLDIKEELTRPLRDIRDDYPTPTLRKRIFILMM